MTWQKTYDGIWPMYFSQDLRLFVTQYGFRDWRWTAFASPRGSHVLARGKASSASRAKLEAQAGPEIA